MPDLNFAQLGSKLPENALITAPDGDIRISIRALTGDTTVTLEDPKVAQALSRLLDGAAQAQAEYNSTDNNSPNLTSYPAPTAGVASRDAAGNWATTLTHSLTVRIPLNRAETTANSL